MKDADLSGTDLKEANLSWGSSNQQRANHGQRGFPTQYRDEQYTSDDDDQTHHFAAYFSAGLANHTVAPAIHKFFDGVGDRALGAQAQLLGQYLRNNPSRLKDVGQLIRDTICNAQPVPN